MSLPVAGIITISFFSICYGICLYVSSFQYKFRRDMKTFQKLNDFLALNNTRIYQTCEWLDADGGYISLTGKNFFFFTTTGYEHAVNFFRNQLI